MASISESNDEVVAVTQCNFTQLCENDAVIHDGESYICEECIYGDEKDSFVGLPYIAIDNHHRESVMVNIVIKIIYCFMTTIAENNILVLHYYDRFICNCYGKYLVEYDCANGFTAENRFGKLIETDDLPVTIFIKKYFGIESFDDIIRMFSNDITPLLSRINDTDKMVRDVSEKFSYEEIIELAEHIRESATIMTKFYDNQRLSSHSLH